MKSTRGVIALEDYQSNYPNDSSLVFTEENNDGMKMEPGNVQYEHEQLCKSNQEIENMLESVTTLDGIASVMEENANKGFSRHAGSALNAAVESLARIEFKNQATLVFPTFEDFSSSRQKRETSMELFDTVKKLIVRAWEAIMRALTTAINWFKEVFSSTKRETARLDKRIDNTKKLLLKIDRNSVNKKMAEKPRLIRVMKVCRVLSINNKVVSTGELVQEYRNHVNRVSALNRSFDSAEHDILRYFSSAIRDVFSDGSAFDEHITQAQSALYNSIEGQPLTGAIADKFKKHDTDSVFEYALVFGGMSVFRTRCADAKGTESMSMYSSLSDSSNVTENVESTEIKPLDDEQVSAILREVSSRVSVTNGLTQKRYSSEHDLLTMKKQIETFIENRELTARDNARAKVLAGVINNYLRYRTMVVGALIAYELKINDALVQYAETSTIYMSKLDEKLAKSMEELETMPLQNSDSQISDIQNNLEKKPIDTAATIASNDESGSAADKIQNKTDSVNDELETNVSSAVAQGTLPPQK